MPLSTLVTLAAATPNVRRVRARWNLILLCLLGVAFGGCEILEKEFLPSDSAGATGDDIEADASAEDLYFEVIRLHSADLLSAGSLEALQRALDEVDGRYQGAEHEERTREAIASFLRRTLYELRQGEQAPVLEAYQGRAYARKLNRAGVREASYYAEQTVFIAGMLGVPTSEEDAALLVAAPIGGYIVVKVGGMALKRAALLLRRVKDADEVVERARSLGFRVGYAADPGELKRLAGDAAVEAVEHAPPHVGAAGRGSGGKRNPWNPS